MNEQADQLPYPVLGDRFTDAFAHAVRLHARQARKDTTISYLTHLMAVCSLVLEDGGDEDQAIAALLHDGPEIKVVSQSSTRSASASATRSRTWWMACPTRSS